MMPGKPVFLSTRSHTHPHLALTATTHPGVTMSRTPRFSITSTSRLFFVLFLLLPFSILLTPTLIAQGGGGELPFPPPEPPAIPMLSLAAAYQTFNTTARRASLGQQADGGTCWQASDVVCLYAQGSETVIVRGPTLEMVGRIAAAGLAGSQ